MNAIYPDREEISCVGTIVCATGPLSRSSVRSDLDTAPCESHPEDSVLIKTETNGWGGARPGAGRKPRVIQSRPTGPRWYVASIFGGDSAAIVQALIEGEDRAGYAFRPPFDVHLPTIATERVVRGKVSIALQPMFPGYLFVRFDRQTDPWGAITTVNGVREVLQTTTGAPLPLPVGYIEWLVEDEPNRTAPAKLMLPGFQPGQSLSVNSGPLSSLSAKCVSCDGRTTAAIVQIMGRETRIVMPRRMFSA